MFAIHRNVIPGCVLFLFLSVSLPARASSRTDTAFPADSGKFILTVQEAAIGSTTFTADPSGSSETDYTINLGGPQVKEHISIKASDGRPTLITADAGPQGKYTLTIHGDKAGFTVSGARGKTFTKEVSVPTPALPFSSFDPHLLTYLLKAYDIRKGDAQPFKTVVVDAAGPEGLAAIDVTLTSRGAKPYTIGGKTVPVSRYLLSVTTPLGGLDTNVLADSEGRVLLFDVPAQKLVAVRDGYQDLTKADQPTDPLLSKPVYTVKKETNVKVAMRDGVKLAADIYRPDASGKFPVILQRTPYGRTKAFEGNFYARRGYVFVAQDVRGKFDSEGAWHPFVNEARDGADTIAWSVAQPWSDGNVGMIGGSYLGFVQWAAAREGNPHLKCLIPIVSPPDPFFNIPYAFGTFFLWGCSWWSAIVEGKEMNAIPTFKDLKPFYALPLKDVDKSVFGHHIPFFQEWLQHPTNDSYWQQVNFNAKMKSLGELPALHVSGWFDGDGIGTKTNYAAMIASGHLHQKLIYGPWPHAVNTSSKLGPLDFGPQSLRDLDTIYLRWFDHWLKGVPNGIDKEPSVDVFLMGANEWRTFSAWPPPEAAMTKWYFHAKGHANADKSDGMLSTETAAADEPADHYTYDPAHPYVPEVLQKALASGKAEDALVLTAPSRDPNLLAYTTEALENDVIVAGPLSVHLTAASSARDTDWFATLEDIYPDGKAIGLCQGVIRARFRNSFEKPEMLTPHQPQEYTLDLWALGNVFKKGHRIRVEIASSCFPIYDRNLNTGGDIATDTKMVTAQQTVYHDAARVSYLVLPTLPR